MAQGDIVLFDHVTQDIASGAFNLYGSVITLIDNTVVAEYDENNPLLSMYHRAQGDSGFAPQAFFPNTSKIVENAVTSYYADSVAWEVFAGCDKVYQAIASRGSSCFCYIDLTDDGGETPWDLSKVPLRITWGEDGLLFAVTVA